MRTTLIALHGYTMNADGFRAQLAPLLPGLEAHASVEIPDAPHEASPAMVARLYEAWGRPCPAGPHRTWWDASDDGRVYAGFEVTRDAIADRVLGPTILLGFSQGAMLASALAALSARGDFPPLAGVVLVAGRVPRAESLQALLVEPVALPSLHVWGERDTMADGPRLAARFDAPERVVWSGPHVVPTAGPAAAAILDFVARCAS